MVEGNSITSFAYGQGKVVFVDDHTLATSTGNGVVFFSIKTNQQVRAWELSEAAETAEPVPEQLCQASAIYNPSPCCR